MIEYEMCDTTKCPKCGHSKSAHIPSFNNPLQDRCDITWDGAYCCECKYYKADFDKEMEWNIVALDSGTLEI